MFRGDWLGSLRNCSEQFSNGCLHISVLCKKTLMRINSPMVAYIVWELVEQVYHYIPHRLCFGPLKSSTQHFCNNMNFNKGQFGHFDKFFCILVI